eukprot:1131339-Rhodomonas_salina.2
MSIILTRPARRDRLKSLMMKHAFAGHGHLLHAAMHHVRHSRMRASCVERRSSALHARVVKLWSKPERRKGTRRDNAERGRGEPSSRRAALVAPHTLSQCRALHTACANEQRSSPDGNSAAIATWKHLLLH